MIINSNMTDAEIIRCLEGVEALHLRIVRDRLRYRTDQITQASGILDHSPSTDPDGMRNAIDYAMHTLARNPY